MVSFYETYIFPQVSEICMILEFRHFLCFIFFIVEIKHNLAVFLLEDT